MSIRLLKPNEIDVRVGGFNKEKTGGFLLLYKDARVDMAILDEVFGMFGWKRKHEVINGKLFCTISIYDKETQQWIDKQDVGVESNNDATKGESSDSFKRACVNVGIGRELYTAPFIWIPGLDKFDKFKVSQIGYNDLREINQLVIVDDKGKERYRLGKPNTPGKTETKPPTNIKISKDLVTKLYNLAANKKIDSTMLEKSIKDEYKKNNANELTKQEYDHLVARLEKVKGEE